MMNKEAIRKIINDAACECININYASGMYSAVIAKKLEEQLESDLATAEQDSRQKQARIERLEKAVKELRKAPEEIIAEQVPAEGEQK